MGPGRTRGGSPLSAGTQPEVGGPGSGPGAEGGPEVRAAPVARSRSPGLSPEGQPVAGRAASWPGTRDSSPADRGSEGRWRGARREWNNRSPPTRAERGSQPRPRARPARPQRAPVAGGRGGLTTTASAGAAGHRRTLGGGVPPSTSGLGALGPGLEGREPTNTRVFSLVSIKRKGPCLKCGRGRGEGALGGGVCARRLLEKKKRVGDTERKERRN